MDSNPNSDRGNAFAEALPEVFQAFTPMVIIVSATCLGTVALTAPNLTDAVRMAFAGTIAAGYGSAGGLARSPQRVNKDQSGIKTINKADNVDVNI